MPGPYHRSIARQVQGLEILAHALSIPLDQQVWTTYDEFHKLYRKTGERALTAIKAGQLCGELALKAYVTYGPKVLWHGSPFAPSELKKRAGKLVLSPRQAFSLDGAGHSFAHTEPAIFCDAKYQYPVVRSLINEIRVPDDFGNVALAKQRDRYGGRFLFTSQEYLDTIGPDAEGWGYGIPWDSNDPDLNTTYRDWISGGDDEFRIRHDVVPVVWIKTKLSDLPPQHLVILDGDGDQVRAFIRELPEAGLAEHMNKFANSVHARTLSGSFPLDTHPAVVRQLPEAQ